MKITLLKKLRKKYNFLLCTNKDSQNYKYVLFNKKTKDDRHFSTLSECIDYAVIGVGGSEIVFKHKSKVHKKYNYISHQTLLFSQILHLSQAKHPNYLPTTYIVIYLII